jgi:hypothetical protein
MKLVNNEIMINYLTLILSILIINNCLTLIKAANIQIFFYSTINKEKIFVNKTIFQFGNEAICQFANLLINLKLKIPNSKLNWSAKIQHLGGGCQGFFKF